ncbi:MAG: phasin family protein [Smithellaceae bacterium]|nr:phasin family protein [Smithellaceae bacterium]
MLEFIKKSIMAGAGLAMMTAEKTQEFFDEMVKKGELSEKEAKDALSDLLEKSKQIRKDMEEKIEKAVTSVLQRLQVPSRAEVEELKARIEQLEKSQGKD